MSDEIKLSNVRPEVAAFAIAMERELRGEEPWKDRLPGDAMYRVHKEIGDLAESVDANTNGDGTTREPERMTPLRRGDLLAATARAACCCMMIADAYGTLDV